MDIRALQVTGAPTDERPIFMRIVIRELFETVILALVIFLGLQFSMGNYRVEGSSMVPTLEEDEYVIVNKLVYMRLDPRSIVGLLPFVDSGTEGSVYVFHEPRRGEVIIFRFPNDPERDFVKRVIALPGETIDIQRGQVRIDGIPLAEPYITDPDRNNMRPQTVPPDSYFVLGDNRRASLDSRDWGPVPVANLIGRAWVSFWPLNRWQSLQVALP
jgi:signal peptidase I